MGNGARWRIREMNEHETKLWQSCANSWKDASIALENVRMILMLQLEETGKPLEILEKAIDAVNGQAYMFTPQTEWTGGDPTDPKNFKINPPHIAR
jgi:hypothetical protein